MILPFRLANILPQVPKLNQSPSEPDIVLHVVSRHVADSKSYKKLKEKHHVN
jgi:hypothetical protein